MKVDIPRFFLYIKRSKLKIKQTKKKRYCNNHANFKHDVIISSKSKRVKKRTKIYNVTYY